MLVNKADSKQIANVILENYLQQLLLSNFMFGCKVYIVNIRQVVVSFCRE
jgi:hypothetical protein